MRQRFYFAGAYARRAELEQRAIEFEAAGLGEVMSRWLLDPQESVDTGLSAGQLETPEQVAAAWRWGQQDIDDLTGSDAIVSFTGHGERGGRHVEHGMAMALHAEMRGVTSGGFRLIVVGPREHVFHCHPATEVYATWDEFIQHETERETNA